MKQTLPLDGAIHDFASATVVSSPSTMTALEKHSLLLLLLFFCFFLHKTASFSGFMGLNHQFCLFREEETSGDNLAPSKMKTEGIRTRSSHLAHGRSVNSQSSILTATCH